MPGPLDGVLVADFSRILAGPYATMLLADLGADVVKVEGPGGDDTRTWTPPVRDGVSTYYLGVNRNKRSIALDLKDDADVRVARTLAARADVVIENFRPGGLTRFGLDYDAVAADEPGRRLRLDQRLRQRRGGREAAGLRPDRAGDLRPDEPDRRPGRAAVPGRHLGLRRDGRAARDHRDPGRAARPRTRPAGASTSRSTCSPPRSPGWSTSPARTSPAAWCRSGWATATRACSPTSRCRAATAT